MTFSNELDKRTSVSDLSEKLDDLKTKCLACAHKCVISDGERGICQVRFNRGGKLYAPREYVSSLAPDPIEKKPFFHVMPGAKTLSFGMFGCNFKCSFCQNYSISQFLKDPSGGVNFHEIKAPEIIEYAVTQKSKVIVSTYNEPVITSEWARKIFKLAHERENPIKCAFVSNGYASSETLDFLAPYLDFMKIDLKTFDRENYTKVAGGKLENVLKTSEDVYQRGIWLEIVTLIIEGFNDNAEQLNSMAEFIAGVSPDIPWHLTAFHPDYKMTDKPRTSGALIEKAYAIAKNKGIRHVYAGNINASDMENTYCYKCGELLVERKYYSIESFNIKRHSPKSGKCPKCGTLIAGVWF